MLLKNYYSNNDSTLIKTTDNKFCSENIYSKFYLRGVIKIQKNLAFLDNGKNFFHIKRKTLRKLCNSKAGTRVMGADFRVKNHVYVNQQNKGIKFDYFSTYSKGLIKPFSKLQELDYLMKKKKNILLLPLKAIKGGFICFFCGTTGFVSKKQIIKAREQRSFERLEEVSGHKKFGSVNILNLVSKKRDFLYLRVVRAKLSISYNKKINLLNSKRKFFSMSFKVRHSSSEQKKTTLIRKISNEI